MSTIRSTLPATRSRNIIIELMTWTETRGLTIKFQKLKKKAEKQHILQDIYKEKSTLRDEHESQQQNYDIARDLYVGELLDEMLDRKKHQEINKTEAYNKEMQSLVGVVRKKYRREIAEFKDYT